MKKIITPLLLSLCFLFSNTINAQLCTDIPIALVGTPFDFIASDVISYGDSMLIFELKNQHPTQFFAYPQAKLVALTPLPPGMSLAPVNLDWMVFASAWNVDSVALVRIYYNVEEPITENYIVTMQIWVNNLSPVTDSCYFLKDYGVNLNPTPMAVNTLESQKLHIFPNPIAANQPITIQNIQSLNLQQFTITNLVGELIKSGTIQNNTIPTTDLNKGFYLLTILVDNGFKQTFKILID